MSQASRARLDEGITVLLFGVVYAARSTFVASALSCNSFEADICRWMPLKTSTCRNPDNPLFLFRPSENTALSRPSCLVRDPCYSWRAITSLHTLCPGLEGVQDYIGATLPLCCSTAVCGNNTVHSK